MAMAGTLLTSAANGQTSDAGASDRVGFDLPAGQSIIGNGSLIESPLSPNSLGNGQSLMSPTQENGLLVRVIPPANRSYDSHVQARSLAGTTSTGYGGFGDEAATQLDIRLGGSSGLNLTTSLGLSSLPREINPADLFYHYGNEIREDRAVATFGVNF